MKKMKWILPLLALAVFLGGCPYGSDVPIEQPSAKVNEQLLGKWELKSSSDETYNITKKDANTYKIEKKSASSSSPTIYFAFPTMLGSDTYLNLYEETADPKVYYLYKVTVNSSATKITLSEVTENIDEKFTTSAELKAFIEKYKGLSFFFSKDETVLIKAD
ncbi:MAG: hypothetical protein U0V74_06465 [Chitinophagales bacterium]